MPTRPRISNGTPLYKLFSLFTLISDSGAVADNPQQLLQGPNAMFFRQLYFVPAPLPPPRPLLLIFTTI
jgi:hypothetical protein